MKKEIAKFYRKRFSSSENKTRNKIWKILCQKVFQDLIPSNATVIDLGAGYCEFINNINCKRKIAIDINKDTKKYASKDVEVITRDLINIPGKLYGKADIVFLSNVSEHLDSKNVLLKVISISKKLLKKQGKLVILQPNIDLLGNKYWDFLDHQIVLNTKSLKELVDLFDLETRIFAKRFLPYTTKTKLAFVTPYLLHIYLLIPFSLRPFAGQSFVVAQKIN